MKKRLLCILLALALILAPLPVSAAQGAAVRCGSGQGQPGDYLYFPITAEDLSAVAAMELALFYDPEVLEFVTCDNGWLLGDALVSSHDAGGSLTLTAISAEGISGSGELFYLGFLVRQDCAPGKYPLTLTAGEVYDTALSPVSLSARGGSVTVTEYAPVYSEFYLEMGLSDDTIAPGETVTAHVRNGWYMAFASCDLSVHYDATMFRLVDARVSGEIAGTVHSLNTDTPGLVRLSCATAENIWCYDLLELTLEAKADAIGTTALPPRSATSMTPGASPTVPALPPGA